MHVHAAHLPGSPLVLHFGRVGGSFEGVRVNSFERVIWARAHPGERAHIKNDKL